MRFVMSAIERATRFGSKGVRIAKAPKRNWLSTFGI